MEIPIKNQWSLTEIVPSDKPALIKYISDKEIADNTMTIPYPYTEKDADWWLNHIEENNKQWGQQTQWAIRSPEGEFSGSIGIMLSKSPIFKHRVEIGYWMGKPFRNQGITSAAIKALSDHCLEKLDFLRVQAFTYDYNIASGRVLEKAGFEKEGFLKRSHFKNGVYLDSVLYAKLRRD